MNTVRQADALQPMEWHYYKIYIGANLDALDFVITDCLAVALDSLDRDSWFFLRYVDEGGLHLRLRIRLPGSEGSPVEREVYRALHDGLSLLSQRVPSTHVPLVSFDGHPAAPAMEGSPVHCSRDRYVPELDVFGGESGMGIAEEVFCVSSDIARKVLVLESRGEFNRKDCVLPFFVEALKAFLNGAAFIEFLERYATFWLSGNPDIGTYKSAFAEKAYAILDEGVEIIPALTPQDIELQSLIARWRKTLRNAHERYKKDCPVYTPVLADTLAFYFIHLMNNRLGFTTLDESYLAVLLTKTYADGYRHAPA
jgi:thiopeptide-type bacteriocin biosynthesis protein